MGKFENFFNKWSKRGFFEKMRTLPSKIYLFNLWYQDRFEESLKETQQIVEKWRKFYA